MVEKTDGCWLWTGATFRHGYGSINIRGDGMQAHRVSFMIHNGAIKDPALCVLHTCDNPNCVNPSHLFIGTHKANTLDMCAKGRHGTKTKPDKIPRGELHGMAKVTAQDVENIRRRYSKGNISQTTLAREFGVQKPAIRKIVKQQTWKHVK